MKLKDFVIKFANWHSALEILFIVIVALIALAIAVL
jgi:hypothetical protein